MFPEGPPREIQEGGLSVLSSKENLLVGRVEAKAGRSPVWRSLLGTKEAGAGRGLGDGQDSSRVCWGRMTEGRYKCEFLALHPGSLVVCETRNLPLIHALGGSDIVVPILAFGIREAR